MSVEHSCAVQQEQEQELLQTSRTDPLSFLGTSADFRASPRTCGGRRQLL
ncbi:hypothetical protein PC116_g11986 [Phytophthora cactorum]|uniref:Uncharacterized protein n=1 Tax=Phytophthora cactorum TaxID=29920 RepID=A0A8T1DQZ7_9STRA|nr:hypothetical protein PC114_g9495 [Phytophthora cactorum]KAG2943724.1 hypothetical protein PC117_g9313 [Phytophthora cactorum]KAG3019909.1 hypothetical protein PC120_g9579 [Phytophthora cactorum]KAG3173864.1 hypothetical protein C6341_g9915 [Phytophthora cactorum]KAG4240043.1 hypothetical protein PC116_g11986 [Phytophthora cactorum]